MFMDPKLQDAARRTRVTVMQGMVETSTDQDVVLTTVLGSCIAACLFDPIARVGGMNHFLLAEPSSSQVNADTHYGIYLMELLVNTMLKQGASKSRMKAHIYGGGNIHKNMQPIGQRNSELAERFLNTENIMITHRDVGGANARRVDFLAASGKARCRHVDGSAAPAAKPTPVPAKSVGDVEFF
ncbi:MAG: chemotaxis protein CheD [Sphingobium sp.]